MSEPIRFWDVDTGEELTPVHTDVLGSIDDLREGAHVSQTFLWPDGSVGRYWIVADNPGGDVWLEFVA